MKIGGIDPRTLPTEEVLVIPRGEEIIVFYASGVTNMDEFKKFCTEPEPPVKFTKDGRVPDEKDKDYQTDMAEYLRRRLAFIVVNSLVPSKIEWDTVKMDNPATWANWEEDLKNSGMTQMECSRVLNLVLEANCLDEKKLRKAREVFLQGPPKEKAE